MDSNQAPKLRDLFEQALPMQPIERAEFLRQIQFRWPLLYADLTALLFAHRAPAAFFEQDGGVWAQAAVTSFIGRRFGPYVIEAEVGRGGMGTVYRATRADDTFHKTVAIKVIAGAAADTTLEAFRRERQILASLEHPYISRLLDGGATEDGMLFLVMEYVDGQALDAYVRQAALPVEAILTLFVKICDAVAYAHRNLIVHRDLKPGNVLVDTQGVPRLLDFGIAKVLDPSSSTTATQALRLTPDFASPEQIRGESITTASDVYSLGVVLFHLLTGGVRPYRTTSPGVQELLNAILERPTIPPSSVAPPQLSKRLAGDLDNIILKAMSKEVARRYTSVEQFADDIRRHLEGRPVIARPDTFFYRSGKFFQRNRLGLGVAALLALSVGAGILTTLQQAEVAKREGIAAQTERLAAVAARQQAEWQKGVAEEQRRHAEKQTLFAQQQSVLAVQQKQLAIKESQRAQQSSMEAQFQSQRAEAERISATQRYQSVRSLATAVLFDVNDALRAVPGSEPSRMKAVIAALNHLELLAKTSNDDVELMVDLAGAYERIGEILSSLNSEGDPANGDTQAFRKAVGFRTRVAAQRLAAQGQADTESQLRLAESKRLLANSFVAHKLPLQALGLLQEGIVDLGNNLARNTEQKLLRTKSLLYADLCQAYRIQSNFAQAVRACETAVAVTAQTQTALSSKLKILNRFISALRSNFETARAAEECRVALTLLRKEGLPNIPPLEELLLHMRAIRNHELLGAGLRLQAMLYRQEEKRDAALELFEESLELLNSRGADGVPPPAMKEVLAFADVSQLQMEAWVYYRNAKPQKAIESCRKAMASLGSLGAGAARVLRAELESNLSYFELPLAANPATNQH